jgi:hypothetical protein
LIIPRNLNNMSSGSSKKSRKLSIKNVYSEEEIRDQKLQVAEIADARSNRKAKA